MKVYKGTDKDIKCRGYQFTPGVEAVEDKAELCESGFHACEAPLDVLGYYPPGLGSRYFEAELEDVSDQRDGDDSKVVGKRITLGAEIGIPGLVKAHVEWVKSNIKKSVERGDQEAVAVGDKESAAAGWRGSAAAGEYGSAAAGEYGSAAAGASGSAAAGEYGSAAAGAAGSAAAGWRGSAAAGEYGSAAAGEYGSAAAGEYGSAAAGASGSAAAGWRGSAAAGWRGSAAAGASGSAVSRGQAASGENGLSVVRGDHVMAKGGLGALLVIAVEQADRYEIKEWKAGVVDGVTLLPDTWYTLKDGEFVEATNDE